MGMQILPQSRCTLEFLDNSHISELTLDLHGRAAPSVGGITAQSVQPQGDIPEEGRTERKKSPQKEAFKILVGTERAMPVSLKSDCAVKIFSFKYLDLSWNPIPLLSKQLTQRKKGQLGEGREEGAVWVCVFWIRCSGKDTGMWHHFVCS